MTRFPGYRPNTSDLQPFVGAIGGIAAVLAIVFVNLDLGALTFAMILVAISCWTYFVWSEFDSDTDDTTGEATTTDRHDSSQRDHGIEAEQLRSKYVTGEIDEMEFERRMEAVLDGESGESESNSQTEATEKERNVD